MPLRPRGADLSVAVPGNEQNALIKHVIGNKNDGFHSNTLYSLLRELELESEHETFIFPEASDLDVVWTAGGVANVFGAWAVVQDNDVPANTLASRFTSEAHIASVLIEQASIVDEVHILEISYGALNTLVIPIRFISGERVFLPPVQQIRVRATIVPAGEPIYYRMMAETAGAVIRVSFRYHFH